MLGRMFIPALGLLSLVSAKWVGYARPSIYEGSAQYTVKIDGKEATTVRGANYDYVQISMDEGDETEFRIAISSGAKITGTPVISPKQLPIKHKVNNNELVFSLKKAHYIIVKLNDLRELVLLLDRTEKDAPPSKGTGIMNVRNHGADNTGKKLTDGIQKTLDAAGKKPGTTVYVPPGVYLTGNLVIPSDTTLYLSGGSVLRMTGKKADYKVMYHKSDRGDGTWWITTAKGSSNIKIHGRGTLDGNGAALTKDKLIASTVVPAGTTNFTLDGPLFRDASFWTLVPTQVSTAHIRNVKILNDLNGKQNDGIDVQESSHVKVWNAIAIANDDAFSTKTWMKDEGTTVPFPYDPMPLTDVSFDACLAWTRCYGFKVGQGVYTDQTDVVFKNSVVYYGGVGLGIHHKFGTGTARNVSFLDMDLERLQGEPGGSGTWLAVFVQDVKRGAGPIRDVTVRNVRARSLGKYHGKVMGVSEEANVVGVTISDVYVLKNTTAAKDLKELDILETQFSKDIKVENSK